MKNQFFNLMMGILVIAVAISLPLNLQADDSAVVDGFRKHVQESSFDDDLKSAAEKKIAAFEDPSDAVTEGLIALYSDYGDAIDSSEDDEDNAPGKQLQPFANSKDPFLAADASFYLARVLMNNERFEDALPLLKNLQNKYRENTTHAGVVDYYLGVAHAGLLKNKNAIKAFTQFIVDYPDAPVRMRVSALNQIQYLKAIDKGKLDDAHQKMEFSRRRLNIEKTDESTQQEQEAIVEILTKLIEEELSLIHI